MWVNGSARPDSGRIVKRNFVLGKELSGAPQWIVVLNMPTREAIRRGFLGKKRGSTEKHHESNLVWGPLGIGCSIVLTVIAAMKHDLRFLFYVAWPCFVFGILRLSKRVPYIMLSYWITVASAMLVGVGLWELSHWLEPPKQTDLSARAASTGASASPLSSVSVPSQAPPVQAHSISKPAPTEPPLEALRSLGWTINTDTSNGTRFQLAGEPKPLPDMHSSVK